MSTTRKRSSRAAAALAILALPWLTPIAGGPSPAVQPWIFSALCACLFASLWRGSRLHPAVAAAAAAFAWWTWIRTGPTLDTYAVVGFAVVVCVVSAAANAAHRQEGANAIAGAWLVAALASTLIALLQFFAVADWLGPLASSSPQAEAFGNLRQRNQFASLTAIGFAACLWFVSREGLRWPLIAAGVLLAVGNAATTSRTGLLQLLVLAALALWWRGDARRAAVQLCALAIGVYAVAAFVLPLLQAAAGIESTSSLWGRVAGV